MEKDCLLRATLVYLYAKTLFKYLKSYINEYPVISKQWEAAQHFQADVIKRCKKILSSANASYQEIVEILIALMIYENKDFCSIFISFLGMRKSVINEYLSNCSSDGFRNIASLLQSTIFYIDKMRFFLQPTVSEIVFLDISKRFSIFSLFKKTNIHLLLHYLPENIRCLSIPINSLETDFTGITHLWIQEVTTMIQAASSTPLQSINSLEELAKIRKDINDILSADLELFQKLCLEFYKKEFSLWSELIYPIFVERSCEITHSSFKLFLNNFISLFSATVNDFSSVRIHISESREHNLYFSKDPKMKHPQMSTLQTEFSKIFNIPLDEDANVIIVKNYDSCMNQTIEKLKGYMKEAIHSEISLDQKLFIGFLAKSIKCNEKFGYYDLYKEAYSFWIVMEAEKFTLFMSENVDNEKKWVKYDSYISLISNLKKSNDSNISGGTWESKKMSLENEEGKSVDEVIIFPNYPSHYVISGLYELCEEIQKQGGYLLDKSIVSELKSKISENLLNIFDIKFTLGAFSALQLFFDFSFVFKIIKPSEELKTKLNQVRNHLKSFIDPIEWALVDKDLMAGADRCSSRYSVLLNFLCQESGRGSIIFAGGTSILTENHNTLAVALQPQRFSLLPTSYSFVEKKSISVDHKKPSGPGSLTKFSSSIQSKLGKFGQFLG